MAHHSLTFCVQKAVAKHVLRYASQAIPMNRVKCKDLIFSRPSVNTMLSKLVVDGRWAFLSGNSSTGKSMGMHYFVRDTMRALAKDRPYIPVTCHLRLRDHDTEAKCKTALALAMGLGNSRCFDWFRDVLDMFCCADPESDSVKKRTVPDLLELLSSTFEQLNKIHMTDAFICPIFWIDDVHSCNRSFVTELCATIVESGLHGGVASTIMTSSEHNTEFLTFLTGRAFSRFLMVEIAFISRCDAILADSGTSKRLMCNRFSVVTEQEIVEFLHRLKSKNFFTTYQTFYDVHGVPSEHKHQYSVDFKVSDDGIRILAHYFRDRFDLLDEALHSIQAESKKGNVDDAFVKRTLVVFSECVWFHLKLICVEQNSSTRPRVWIIR